MSDGCAECAAESITTVLIAMGYCGGSLDNICARQRLVIPNLDDCITMLLTIAEKNRLWKLVMKKAAVYTTPEGELRVHI